MNSFPLSNAGGNGTLNGNTFKILKVTNNPALNGQELIRQYENIKEVSYNQNQSFSLFLPPGKYDLGGQSLNLYRSNVDIIGLGNSSDQQQIYSAIPTGAVVNIISDKISLKKLSITNTYEFPNPTGSQLDTESAYTKTSDIRSYGLYAPACLYYSYKFFLSAFDPANPQQPKDFVFENLNNKYHSSLFDAVFPSSWGLNTLNTPLYKDISSDVYIGKFENASSNTPLGWYLFNINQNQINIFARGLDVDATFPWECKSWRTFTSPFVYFNFDFKIWPTYKMDYINVEDINLVENNWTLSMASNSCYVGNFKNVKGGVYSFGGMDGMAVGKYENCEGGFYSFGQAWDINRTDKHLHLSGEFINCKAGFGSFGQHGLIAGSFDNCKQSNDGTRNIGNISDLNYGTLTGDGSVILNAFSFGSGALEDSVSPGGPGSTVTEVLWDESADGDLSNNPFDPTNLGPLSYSQDNSIIHIIKNSFQNSDPDYFSLQLPANKMITEVVLKSFTNSDAYPSQALLAIKTGVGWDIGNDSSLMIGSASFNENDLNLNLFTKMNNIVNISNSPLTFRLQYPGGQTTMELEIKCN